MTRRSASLIVRDAALIVSPSIALGVTLVLFDLQLRDQTMELAGELLIGVGLVVAGWRYGRTAQRDELLGIPALPDFARYTTILSLALAGFSAALSIAGGVKISSLGVPFWGVVLIVLIALGLNWMKVFVSLSFGAWLQSRWGSARVHN